MKLSNFAKAFYSTAAVAATGCFSIWLMFEGLDYIAEEGNSTVWLLYMAAPLIMFGLRIASSKDPFVKAFVPCFYETVALCAVVVMLIFVTSEGDELIRFALLAFLMVQFVVHYKLNMQVKLKDERFLEELLDEFVVGD